MYKIKIKIVLLIIILILFQATTYFLTKLVQISPVLLNSGIDNKIPYVPYFVYFYIIWYPMLLLIPYIIYIKNKEVFYKYITTYVISVLICGIIFIIFPTTINRANITETDISNKLVNLLYIIDQPPVNCLPSIHCLVAFLFIFGISKVNLSNRYKLIVYILSICIVLSTLFIKQHVVYDAIASFVIVSVVWIVVNISNLNFNLKNIYRNYPKK